MHFRTACTSSLDLPALRRPLIMLLAILVVAVPAAATTQIDIHGPPGSIRFGAGVVVLPNGNFAVAEWNGPGAVHLYSPEGELISTITGAGGTDAVGTHLLVLANGDFLVLSPGWDNAATGAENAGAVTRVDGEYGLSGVVSAANSLVGSSSNDRVGVWVRALPDGGFVVSARDWDNGAAEDAGAVVVVPAGTNTTGPVSRFNALVGTRSGDQVGSGLPAILANGNIVIGSPNWDNGQVENAGASTWMDAGVGLVGAVSATNSLIGSAVNTRTGFYNMPLTNGNYVVGSPGWGPPGGGFRGGAVTWVDGSVGAVGEVEAADSLIGGNESASVGSEGVWPLANGHYVVLSPFWGAGDVEDVGAVTWGNGDTGTTGVVGASNSLIGGSEGDEVGYGRVLALDSGDYVVLSPAWSNGSALHAGAATWRDGSGPAPGVVSASNSLVGRYAGDSVGAGGQALANGNYVVASPSWNRDATPWGHDHGAVTWGDGSGGRSGLVSEINSMVGSQTSDRVGLQVLALDDGNYVVRSSHWDNAGTIDVGAVTWGDGSSGTTGQIGPGNSLIGANADDRVGWNGIGALPGGGYAIASSIWNGPGVRLGAVTVVRNEAARNGVVGLHNSLVGSADMDHVGGNTPRSLGDGSIVVHSPEWDHGALPDAGALTLVGPNAAPAGPVGPHNSLIGTVQSAFQNVPYAYDPARGRLVVGRPLENRVTLMYLPTRELFSDGFE